MKPAFNISAGRSNRVQGSLMAGLGGFSPRLVWEGAQKAGLTTLQLH